MTDSYKTYRAMEQAVKAAAKASGRDVNKAIQGFYHDRFLCRVFSPDEPSFILKGGQSMLAHIPNVRETRDIDLVGKADNLDKALDDLVNAASVDLGDFIEFRLKSTRPTEISQDYREGYTVVFETWLGKITKKNDISIDLVVDALAPVDYDVINPISRLEVKGLETHEYLANTVESRIAEKVCATLQDYNGRPSSRLKDLVDLATMMLNEPVNGRKLAGVLATERSVRKITELEKFKVPDAWKSTFATNYRKLAKEASLPEELQEIATAEKAVATWLQPIINGDSDIHWDPTVLEWAGAKAPSGLQ